MPRKTKIGTEVAHVTRDSDTTFKVKGQGHQAALLTAVLARQAAAAVGVGTCWPWETAQVLELVVYALNSFIYSVIWYPLC